MVGQILLTQEVDCVIVFICSPTIIFKTNVLRKKRNKNKMVTRQQENDVDMSIWLQQTNDSCSGRITGEVTRWLRIEA